MDYTVLILFAVLQFARAQDPQVPPCEDGYCPLDNRLLALNSSEGYSLLFDGKPYHYFQYIHNMETQRTSLECWLGTTVTVLNSMHLDPPHTYCDDDGNYCYRHFTQDYIFYENNCTAEVAQRNPFPGLSISQVAELFQCFNLTTKIYKYQDTSREKFRELFKLSWQKGVYVIANYQRGPALQQPLTGAHFSPVGAFSEKADRVLMLDVARYKYPPEWVPTEEMIDAISTWASPVSSRGILLVYGPNFPGQIAIDYDETAETEQILIAFTAILAITTVVLGAIAAIRCRR